MIAESRAVAGWISKRYSAPIRLLPLQDLMKEFEAKKLVCAMRCLLANSQMFVDAHAGGIVPPVSRAVMAEVEKQAFALLECCKSASLPMSVLAMTRLQTLFGGKLSDALVAKSVVDAVQRSLIIVEDELSLRMYFSLEPEEAESYKNPWKGWEGIVARFGDTTRDIEEMNKCFALGRFTAAMFHALHVAEWGAIALGDYIGVTDPKRGWGATEKKLAEILKGGHPKLPLSLAGKFAFLEQMGREIDSMVLAWRHKVDHAANHLAIVPNAEFTPDIAEHIIGGVRVFMTRLVDGIPV